MTNLVVLTTSAGAASSGSKAPIVVGGQGDLSISPGISQGFDARITAFNKAGGLDGRKIKYLGFTDDGLSPTNNLADAQKLVEEDHVFADVPFNSEVCTAATGTFLAQNKIPFIGYAVCPAFGPTDHWGFGYEGDNTIPTIASNTTFVGLAKILHKQPSQVKLAVEGLSVTSVDVVNLTAAAKKLGMDIVLTSAGIPLTATNYQPYAEAVVSSGATAVYTLTLEAGSAAFAVALKAAGFKGLILTPDTYEPDQLNNPNIVSALQDVYTSNTFPVGENNTPATREALKDLQAIGQPPLLTNGVAIGYWTGDFFVQALKATAAKVGAANVTSQEFQKVISNGYTFHSSLPGGIGPETFPHAFSYPTPCLSILVLHGKKYQAAYPYSCTENYSGL
jgi:ABC-type branched-subunit amino acid transport system substrate-binding protein